ncbi:MAG: cyclic nucleotide-binding domain-containing protein [Anaerolineae bacterium]|nr:cyclic nucleotide-binding domain-containing protein [Anaerolineae bacterium]
MVLRLSGGRPFWKKASAQAFFTKCVFFENLRPDQLCALAVNQGDYVIHKGKAGDSLFIVVEGQIKIVDPGSENVLAVLSSGEVLGEISLFDGGLRSADAYAETPTLLVINRDTLADDPGMLRVMALPMNMSEIRK